MKLPALGSAVVYVCACGTSAFAQTTTQNGSIDADTTAAAAEQPASEDGDIIVTALKQSTTLQKTPAAISVVGGEELVQRSITDIRAIGPLVPSFKTNSEGTATQIFARGVGKQVDLGNIPDAVGMVVDGLSYPQHATAVALFDVSSIQVLPGPQGTLYGSSAIGGVVNVSINRPEHNKEGSLLLEVGNYGSVHATVLQNLPVTNNWALRAGYSGNYRDGYNDNGTGNDNMTAFRLSSLFTPDDTFSFYLTALYAFDKYRQAPTIPYPFLTDHPYNIMPFDPDTAIFYPPNGGATDGGRVEFSVATLTGEIQKKFDDITVTYTSGYLRRRTPGVDDGLNQLSVAGFTSFYQHNNDIINNELRINNSSSSRLSWIAGLYQYYAKNKEYYIFGPNLSGQDYSTIFKTYAAYGQGTFSLTDRTRLTTGLRFSKDTTRASENSSVFFPVGAFPNFSRGEIPFAFNKSWTRLNWKVGAEQDLSSTSLLYAGVQSGFNPGTFDGNPPTPARTVEPQSMIGYTVGLKNRIARRLTLNLEAFLYNYKNQIIAVPNLASGTNILVNAQRSRIYGAQLDSAFDLTDTTKLRANIGYLHARFTQFNYASGGLNFDYAGNTPPFSPELTVSLGATQIFDLANGGQIEARADSYITSSYVFTFDNIPNFEQPSYHKTDLGLSWRSPNRKFEIGLWVKNLENEATVASAGVAPGRSYPGVVYLEPPRTYGGRLLVKW